MYSQNPHEAGAAVLLNIARADLISDVPALVLDLQARYFIGNPAFCAGFAWAGAGAPFAVTAVPDGAPWAVLLERIRDGSGDDQFFDPPVIVAPSARRDHWRCQWRRMAVAQSEAAIVKFIPVTLHRAELRQIALAALARVLAAGCSPRELASTLHECGCADHGAAIYTCQPDTAAATLESAAGFGQLHLPGTLGLAEPARNFAEPLRRAIALRRPVLVRPGELPGALPAGGLAVLPLLPGAGAGPLGVMFIGLDDEPDADPSHGAFLSTLGQRVAAAMARSLAPAPAPSAAGQARIRVLLVDDEPLLVDYVRIQLRHSCDVLPAASAEEGLARALAERPDLILIDHVLPGVSGIELLRTIRRHPEIHTIPVMVLSGRGDEATRLAALAAGADDFIGKPFSGKELAARIRSHVELARLRRTSAQRESRLLHTIRTVKHDFERLLADTNDAFLSLDHELRIVALNAATARLLDGEPEAPLGMLLAQVAPTFVAQFGPLLERVIAEQVVQIGEFYADRPALWFAIRAYPSMGGVVVVGADITHAKRAADLLRSENDELESRVALRTAQLQAANALLTAVFDRAPAGIVLASTDGRYLRANRAFQQLVGYTEQELCAQTLGSFCTPENDAATQAALARLRCGAAEGVEMELNYRRKDGGRITCASFISRIVEPGGSAYVVKTAWDITDRKRAEQQLRRSQQELRELLETLQSVRADESARLAREVHDQLGQILTVAMIDLELLETNVADPQRELSAAEIVHELRCAKSSLDAAIGSVQGIALLLRPPELREHGLVEAIRWHARDFERRTRIACEVRHEPQGYREPAPAVAGELFRLCQEALTNVLRHAGASGVLIDVRGRGDQLLMRIVDNGIGIERAHVRDLRAIGLRGMRERAALVRGKVGIRGQRGRGTMVAARVRLPRNRNQGN